MGSISFGQYFPSNSIIHKMDSRFKILASIFYFVLIFTVQNFIGYGITFVFLLTTILISKIPLKLILKSMKAIIFLVIFTAILNVFFMKEGDLIFHWWIIKIYTGGLIFAAKMSLRLLLLVLGTSMLTLTTTPMELTDGIESLLKPLKVIKFPVHDLAIIMSITLRMIPALMEEANKIIMAQKARGADFESGGLIKRAKALIPILIPLFVGAFRRADELAFALDSRCYNATDKRTKMKVLRFSGYDLLGLIGMVAFGAFLIIDRIYLGTMY